jgi:hypothetical protein
VTCRIHVALRRYKPRPFVVADSLQIPASFVNQPIVGLLMGLTVLRVAATSGATTAAERADKKAHQDANNHHCQGNE